SSDPVRCDEHASTHSNQSTRKSGSATFQQTITTRRRPQMAKGPFGMAYVSRLVQRHGGRESPQHRSMDVLSAYPNCSRRTSRNGQHRGHWEKGNEGVRRQSREVERTPE